MKILTINMLGIPSGIDRNLISANVFQDYDAVLVNPTDFENLYSRVNYDNRERRKLNTSYGDAIDRLNERRHKEVRGLLRSGGIVVCLLQPIQVYHYEYVFQGSYVTGEITNYDWLFNEKERAHELGDILFSKGETIDITDSNHPFAPYLSTKPSWLAYVDIDACSEWKILASAFGTNALALAKRIDMGHIVFIPSDYDYNNGELLERCIIELHKGKKVTPQPAWAKNVLVPGQSELLTRVEELNESISFQEKQRQDIINKIENLERWKYLLYGKGKYELEIAVREALTLIRCSVEPQPEKDSDGIISSEYGTALLEATGSKGTIRIEKLGELNTNIGNYISKRRSRVHGIIAGNPFCEEPLDNRPPKNTQKDLFAKELIDSATEQSITVLLTTDLYDVVSQILSGKITEESLASIRERIFRGKGLVHLI